VKASVASEPQTAAPVTEEPLVLPGVVIEEIPKGSALEKAGLQVGDVILSWERLPSPPANPEATSGKINSPFDWMWVEIEQAPRGVLRLRVNTQSGLSTHDVLLEPIPVRVRPRYRVPSLQRLSPGSGTPQFHHTASSCSTPDPPATIADQSTEIECWMILEATVESHETWAPRSESCQRALRIAEAAGDHRLAALIWLKLAQVSNKKEVDHYAQMESLIPLLCPDSLLLAILYEAAGNYSLERGNTLAAKAAHLNARKIRHSAAPRSLILAESIEDLGVVEHKRTRYQAAKRLYEEALEIRSLYAPGSSLEAKSLGNLGVVAMETGELDRAEALLTRTLGILRVQAAGTRNEAITLNNLAYIATARGNFDWAEKLYLDSLAIQEKIEPKGRGSAKALGALGGLYYERNDLYRARIFLAESLAIYKEEAPKSQDAANVLAHLGNVSFARGDLDEADELYREALLISRRSDPENTKAATYLQNLGLVAIQRGEYELAHAFLGQALSMYRKFARGTIREASILRGLGVVADKKGSPEEALRYYKEALGALTKLGDENPERANILENVSILEVNRGNYREAERLNLEALRIQQRHAAGQAGNAPIYHRLGTIAYRKQRWAEAMRYFQLSLELTSTYLPWTFLEARNLYWLGLVQAQEGNPARAVEFWKRSIVVLEKQEERLGTSMISSYEFARETSAYYRDLTRLLILRGSSGEAFSFGERYRARLLLKELSGRDILDSAMTSPELEKINQDLRRARASGYLELELQAYGGSLKRNGDAEASAKLLRLEADHAAWVSKVRRNSPRLAALRFPEPLDEERARDALDTGTLLLSYFLSKTEAFLFVLSPEGEFLVYTLPIGENDLREQVERFRNLITEARPGTALGELRQKDLRRLSKELFNSLVAPAADRIEKADRVLIVADGPLHYLPFAALVREAHGEDGHLHEQYLAEWKPFHSVLSVTVYAEIKKDRRDSMRPRIGSPLLSAFGDPQFSPGLEGKEPEQIADVRIRSAVRRSTLQFDPLPFTRREVEGVAALFPPEQVAIFLGAEATEERAKAIGKGTRILHFATHTRLDDRFPLDSALVLTMPEGFPEDRDNGLLQVWEIFEKVRLDADLVVLSACDTGLGEEQGGEGLIGLTRAFQYAGARTVMASLWSVQDRATSELMIHFYKHLRAGLPKDEALRQAQIELIRGPIEVVNQNGEKTLLDASAPYYWAGFQVYGDWQ
jgi:CHAT domain-containing protein/Tfp pilus assembly protein PilF